jgi:uncharacterized membrane protein YgdD (TMEM256/DUF423 family)
MWTRANWLTLAALAGLLSVGFGAFAAHGVSDPRAQDLLRTGSLYAFVHVLATLLTGAVAPQARLAPALFLAGVLLFAGSLWAIALGAPRWLGAVTPFGGLSFMGGWIALAWAVRRSALS